MKHLFLFAAALFIGAVSIQAQHGTGASVTLSPEDPGYKLWVLESTVATLVQENASLKGQVLQLQTDVNNLKTQMNGMAGFTKVGNRWTLAAGINEVVIQAQAISLNASGPIGGNASVVDLNARTSIGLRGSSITVNDQPISGAK